MISPLLANIYLHYSFDLGGRLRRKKWAQGDVVVVRYTTTSSSDSSIKPEAERFWRIFGNDWGSRWSCVRQETTDEIRRFARPNRERRGEGKPETFEKL